MSHFSVMVVTPNGTEDEVSAALQPYHEYETNPDSKWDWWVIGGRWRGCMHNAFGTPVDREQLVRMDFEDQAKLREVDCKAKYRMVQGVISGRDWLTWAECKEKFNDDIGEAREFYHGQDVMKDLGEKNVLEFFEEREDYKLSEDEYVDKRKWEEVTPYALVMNGEWHQKGDVGWWGLSSNEDDDWDQKFLDLIKQAPAKHYVTMVDCHI